jgi:hypothetical protein
MSLNMNNDGTESARDASTGSTVARAPRLTGAIAYAAWRTDMDLFLQRTGAENVHTKKLEEKDWKAMAALVEQWNDSALADALALVTASAGGSSSTSGATAPTNEQTKARKVITANTERSQRAYGAIVSALSEDLRAQSADIARGWAYGLWKWLEAKFQSTEEDSVGELFAQWSTLKQTEGEVYDAYRARVNKLRDLLDSAKERPSDRMYAYMLLDRLLPRYKPAVLALKAGGQLKDAKKIEWDTVSALINAHERQELRLDESTSESPSFAMAASADRASNWRPPSYTPAASGAKQSASRVDQQRGPFSEVKCYNCEGSGHISRDCKKPQTKATRNARAARDNSAAPGGTPARYGRASSQREGEQASAASFPPRSSSNRFESLSSDDEEDADGSGHGGPSKPRSGPGKKEHKAFAATVDSGKRTYASIVMRGAQSPPPAEHTNSVGWTPNWSTAPSVAMGASIIPAHRPSRIPRLVAPMPPAPPRPLARHDAPAAAMAGDSVPSAPPRRARSPTPPAAARAPAREQAAEPARRKPVGIGANPDKALSNSSWGIDSMASLHISGNKELFTGLKKCPPLEVRMADHGSVTVNQYGTVHIRVDAGGDRMVRLRMENVYYHERFSTNLLSLGVLKKLKWEFHCTDEETYVKTPGGNKVRLSTRGRVFVMPSAEDERVYSVDGIESATVDTLVRQHERLGHMSFDRMIALLKGNAILDIKKLNASDHILRLARLKIHECRGCLEGKGTRVHQGRRGIDKGSAPGETLHMDTFQIRLEHEGRSWLEYGVTVTDPFTQCRWFEAFDTKDQVAAGVADIITNARTRLECKVKRIHADGGSEFVNATLTSYCKKHGIDFYQSPPRTQSLNGVAENSVRASKDGARTLLHHAKSPQRFWKQAAEHATFIWNRTKVSRNTGVTPYETMFKRKPSARHWGVFGCDTYVHVPKEQRRALDAKMEPGIYLGHHWAQNCARVYLLRTRKIINTKDVTYKSGSFEYCRLVRTGNEARIRDVLEEATGPANPTPTDADEPDESYTYTTDPQGGRDAPDEEKEQQPRYDVEAVLGQRMRRGVEEFRVKWIGYNETTWEPASTMEEDAPDSVEEFRSSRQHAITAAPPRQSPRFRSAPTPASSSSESSDSDSEQDEEPRVHMVMCAIKALQTDLDRRAHSSSTAAACAFSAGTSLLENETPLTFRAAMSGPQRKQWAAAMDKEIASCEALQVWELVQRSSLPHGTNILPCKWVYRIKTDEHGNITIYKARITPKGFKQKEGEDYFEVFARTGMYKTMRLGLSLTAKFDHELEQLDIPTAFLNADVDEVVYMEMPEGYRDSKRDLVCRLKKSLYGLKQAPRNWYLLVSKFITEQILFKACISDPCLYWRRSRTGRLMLLYLFVDDFQGSFHRDDRAEWDEIKAALAKRFNAKDLGESKWILGMEIRRDRVKKTIFLGQELYITKGLEKYGFSECRTAPTPEAVGAAHQDPTEEQSQLADRQRFMEITGTLMYAAISTRPDIAHAVNYLAAHMLTPTQMHMAAAERVLRYLAGTKHIGLIFGSRNDFVIGDSRGKAKLDVNVCAYADADWANNRGDRRSVTGWVSKINGDPISWASKKQRTVALSTCEAELYAEAAAIQEVLWLRGILKELGLYTSLGSTIYGDNQAAIAVSKNGVKGERTKHVDVKYHFITETVESGVVQLQWIPTLQQQADIFTKALAVPGFEHLRAKLMSH